jgi:hypothetical protein
MIRQCSKCGSNQSTNQFHKRSSRKSGFNSWCKLCVKKWKVKFETIDAYGGKCVCCKEDEIEFLTIDHIFGDGAEERKKYGAGSGIYRHLRRNGYPKDRHRLLCWNCNSSIGVYGYCPHNINGKTCRISQPQSLRGSINRSGQKTNKSAKIQSRRLV